MTINVIVAVSDNGVIGKDGKIPWKLGTHEKRFSGITHTQAYMIMGNRTFDSISPPLHSRKQIVITRRPRLVEWANVYDGQIIQFMPIEWLIPFVTDYKRKYKDIGGKVDLCVIGGQQIYDEIFKTPEIIHRVYLTRVHCEVEDGDTFFNYPFPFSDDTRLSTYTRFRIEGNKRIFGCLPGTANEFQLIDGEFISKSDTDEYDSTFQIWENRNGQ